MFAQSLDASHLLSDSTSLFRQHNMVTTQPKTHTHTHIYVCCILIHTYPEHVTHLSQILHTHPPLILLRLPLQSHGKLSVCKVFLFSFTELNRTDPEIKIKLRCLLFFIFCEMKLAEKFKLVRLLEKLCAPVENICRKPGFLNSLLNRDKSAVQVF